MATRVQDSNVAAGTEPGGLSRRISVPMVAFPAHAALAFLVAQQGIATMYAAAVLLGVITMSFMSRRLDFVLAGLAYLAMSDVLWRMTDARVFYESGKYGLVIVAVVAGYRFQRGLRGSFLPLAFIAALVPSALLTISLLGFEGAREPLSFNLSGPLSLAVCAWFLGGLRTTWEQLRPILLVSLLPVTTIATIASRATFTSDDLVFTDASNFTTSGGFGPNQVSALLGLGALVCLVLILRERRPGWRLLEFALGFWFFAQSLLTFSRGGGFNLVVAGALLLLWELVRSAHKLRLLAIIVALGIGGILVFSRTDAFTEGSLKERFSETSTSNRGDIAASDLDLWRDNRFIGVGPGLAKFSRPEPRFFGVSPHTEFTRLLAEHGLLGLLSLVPLLWMIVARVLRAPTAWNQALTVTFVAWALSETTHAAMRLGAISFVFGLAFVTLISEPEPDPAGGVLP
ncbi:MAG: putative rane protein [Solirubrobacteraceae bacterium]|nr:putative rane protein [Solirubrobacteraceae bacterium]